MDTTEKNGQPSMEEILASIRRIIAEEPADAIAIDLGSTGRGDRGDGLIEDAGDFELPSMFRASAQPATDKATPTFGRLTDAVARVSGTPTADGLLGDLRTETGTSLGSFPAETGAPLGGVKAEPAPRGDDSSNAGLSSLKSARGDIQHGHGDAQHANEAALPHGASDHTQHASQGFPSAAPAADSPVARQMAPFKDQRFSRMSVASSPLAPAAGSGPVFPPAAAFPGVVPTPAAPKEAAPRAAAPAGAEGKPQDKAASGGVTQPIEDATAELLRPMLRQWLSDNMPRMVEKALHIELAESLRSGKKPGTT